MDQFCFNKKFTCDIVAALKNKRINPSPQSSLEQYEADFFSQDDNNLTKQTKKSKKQFNSSLQNPSKRGDK